MSQHFLNYETLGLKVSLLCISVIHVKELEQDNIHIEFLVDDK